ncbi:hypothetical protein F5Y00DRAFT_111874 [Daldinia vernicosa]|uniref:uncharacterized protein n=1 Tax=Daldinia vernicosa TaxID=114800 RepID=UPI002007F113|nr:uncharacterized protein F5Y00DRAFT_111874 [Daldinia vernicosa]KAI0847830.1 hypothetical protein F5Y00DRAFT_111874 [Daldinia vernicosa]
MGSTPKTTPSVAASPAKGKAAVAATTTTTTTTTKKPPTNGVTKRSGRKAAAKKGAGRGKGRGQKKVYSDPRVQAAYERQRELRDLYSQVALAVKPALEEIADQTLKKLTESMDGHKGVAEYYAVQEQLDQQLQHVIETAERERRTRDMISQRTYELDRTYTQRKYINSFEYQTEELYDGAENRASILAELHREGQATDPTQTLDLTYHYVDHIPYVSFTGQSDDIVTSGKGRKGKAVGKRKADDQPDGQADSKKPRHTAGLLASEQQPDGVPESNVATPTPPSEQEFVVSGKNFPDLPAGAGDPDEYGVRSVNKRAKSPRNRFIVPPLFQFDDKEIGFRDSTNDSSRKATRAVRGMFLDTPNSNTWHWDHTVKDYDARDYKDDTLDPEVVKKHGLHPKYGMFLPNSTNESEYSHERVDGTRPVVVVPDKNTTIHASRSTRPMKMDMMLKEDRIKGAMAGMLQSFCQKEEVDPEEIVTDEMRDRERRVRERLTMSSDDTFASGGATHPQSVETDSSIYRDNMSLLLQAAEILDAGKPTQPSPTIRPSRPYDAVRDVFTSTEPAPSRPERYSEGDVNALSIFADAALELSQQQQQQQQHQHQQQQQQQLHQRQQADITHMSDSSMIDPRLLGPPAQPPALPNAFLQTALNPASAFAHIAPAPTAMMELPQQPAPPRMPFSSQSSVRETPILPPLRPNRADGLGKSLNITQPPLTQSTLRQQEFDSPRGLVHSNSGTFFAPAPSRPFHQGLTFHHDSTLMPMSLQQGPPMSGSGMLLNQPHIPHMSAYPLEMSPPLQSQPHLAPLSTQMEVPAPSTSPIGPPLTSPSSPAHTPRGRGSTSSNGNNAGKYRKIAAAPIPHNRPWPSNGGPELRLAHYDHKEAIKDYRANEPPPRTGPTTIRGWNVNNVSKSRNKNVKKEDSEEKESPK